MKRGKGLALIAAIIVNWTLLFRQTYDDIPKEIKREKKFSNDKEAQEFYDHRPKSGDLFECVNSDTSMPGFCEIKEATITKLDKGSE